MRILVIVLVTLAIGVIWMLERAEAVGLSAQASALRQESEGLGPLHRERDRLRQLQLGSEELAELQLAAADHARIGRELATLASASDRSPPAQLAVGRWLPSTAWRNRGQQTPTAAVETALWAAAGGDVASLRNLLQLDEAVRARAGEVLARLPETSRALYPDPEYLIAAFTTKAIPLGDAQLVWLHESGPDDAVAGVFVKTTDTPAAALPVSARSPSDRIPPMAPPNNRTKSAYLSLRRVDDRWQLVAPMSAVENIAKELGGAVRR